MSDKGELIALRKNVDGLIAAVTQLQERERENRARIEQAEHELVEVKTLGQELRAVLHTINLKALGAAVRQLQEKYREMMRTVSTLVEQE